MKHFEKTLETLKGGASIVLVNDPPSERYASRLSTEDPLHSPPRPVAVWQRGVGFLSTGDFPEQLPDDDNWSDTLNWIGRYRGKAIFVLECGDLRTLADARSTKKMLATLKHQLVERPVSVIVVSASPLPQEYTEIVPYLGGIDTTPAGHAATIQQTPSRDWRDLQQLSTFDTNDWETRLDELTAQDIEDLIAQRAHLPVIDRINELRSELGKRFESRDKIVDALCCAAIAQVPTVLIGPPGTAKSALVRAICEGLGLTAKQQAGETGDAASRTYFEYMLTRFTTPEEIFGPWHIDDLIKKGIYHRVTVGHLPEARIAFLDEIFKASGAILNTLLTLLNEKIFYNGGRAVRAPLLMAFAASNELPSDEGLKALVDRFPLRILCPRVDRDRRGNLIQRAWEQGFDRQFSSAGVAIGQLACPNDLRLLHQVIRVVYGGRKAFQGSSSSPSDFQAEFMNMFHRFEDLVSDRTAPQLLSFARAHALLLSRGSGGEDRIGRSNRDTLPREALEVYRYISCDEQHQRNYETAFRQTPSRL